MMKSNQLKNYINMQIYYILYKYVWSTVIELLKLYLINFLTCTYSLKNKETKINKITQKRKKIKKKIESGSDYVKSNNLITHTRTRKHTQGSKLN